QHGRKTSIRSATRWRAGSPGRAACGGATSKKNWRDRSEMVSLPVGKVYSDSWTTRRHTSHIPVHSHFSPAVVGPGEGLSVRFNEGLRAIARDKRLAFIYRYDSSWCS